MHTVQRMEQDKLLSWSRGMVRYPTGEQRQMDFGLAFAVADSSNLLSHFDDLRVAAVEDAVQ